MWAWVGLLPNIVLLVVASVLVADVAMGEDSVVLILTGLCTLIF